MVFCFLSADSKLTWQGVVAAWFFNKGETEIYKPTSSYLRVLSWWKIKWQAGHMAPPVLDSHGLPQHPLQGLHSNFWGAACGNFSLHSKGRVSSRLWWHSISAAVLLSTDPLWHYLELSPGVEGWGEGAGASPGALSRPWRRKEGCSLILLFLYSLGSLNISSANSSLLQSPIKINNYLYVAFPVQIDNKINKK